VAHEFRLPDIGEGLTEATVLSWYVAVGASVGLDEPLVEVETDKAVVDIPAPHAGVLLYQGAASGERIAVDALLAVVGESGETWSPTAGGPVQVPPATGAPTGSGDAAPIVGRLEETSPAVSAGGPQALPLVRRLASQLGVDLAAVAGSGPGGRITEEDVRGAAAGTAPVRRSRMSATRRAIADNLARSWREIPHVTTYAAVDAEPLLAARAAAGKPPLEALLVARIVPLLVEYPLFNASVVGDEIVERLHYDVGFAVDTPDGLMVAVIRDAAGRDVAALGDEIRRLAAAVRERTAALEEVRGQTFTVSNIGAVGGGYGTPIVPYGTTAILGVGRADPQPVVRDGQVVVGRELPLSLSYDHRAIDGAAGRAFMAALVAALGAP
jgi:pyruvate/2-oxoglutarate dehydrogenase complex dihydrolipoamide acyltransferase (E2) component